MMIAGGPGRVVLAYGRWSDEKGREKGPELVITAKVH